MRNILVYINPIGEYNDVTMNHRIAMRKILGDIEAKDSKYYFIDRRIMVVNSGGRIFINDIPLSQYIYDRKIDFIVVIPGYSVVDATAINSKIDEICAAFMKELYRDLSTIPVYTFPIEMIWPAF